MRRRAAAPLLLVLALVCSAEAVPKERPKSPSSIIEGTVRGPNGAPAENALVLAWRASLRPLRENPIFTRTDWRGAFRLGVGSTSLYNVRAKAPGLAPQVFAGVAPGTSLAILLTQGAEIEGVVRDGKSKKPVVGARVEAVERLRMGSPSPPEPEPGLEVVTDEQGRYRLEGLARAPHVVAARARGYGRSIRSLMPPDARGDFYLSSGSSLTGTVLSPAGKPVPGAYVHAEPDSPFMGGSSLRYEVSDRNGRFEIVGLGPGLFRLTSYSKDYAPGVAPGIVIQRHSIARSDVTLRPAFSLTGRLADPEGRPWLGRVVVESVDGYESGRDVREILRGQAGNDGRFRIDLVPPGSHVLRFYPRGHSSQTQEVRVRGKKLVLDLGDVVVVPGVTIQGRVRDRSGTPIPGARVAVATRSGEFSEALETDSEADGSFILAGLTAGTYRLRAVAAGYAQKLRETSAPSEAVEMILDRTGAIVGTVVDEEDEPVGSFVVRAAASGRAGPWGQAEQSVEGSPGGSFQFQDVNPGTYVVVASSQGRAPATAFGIKVLPGATTDLGRLQLGAGRSLRGLVVETGGAAVPGATVTALNATSSSDRTSSQAMTDGTGTFEINGLAGDAVDLIATHPDYAEGRASSVSLDPAKRPSEARIVLSRGGRIEGYVRRSDGAAVSAIVRLTVGDDDPFATDGGDPQMAPVSERGFFVLDNVTAGTARVAVMATLQGSFAPQVKRVLLREGETARLEFVIREILIRGTVTTSGVPLCDARIRMRPPHGVEIVTGTAAGTAGGLRAMSGVTGPDGGYALLVPEPGDYTVEAATSDGRRLPSRNVSVPETDTYTLNLSFDGGWVSGAVVDAETQQPIRQASVKLLPSNGRASAEPGAGVTDHEGRFLIEVDPGEYRSTAQAEGYGTEAGPEIVVDVGSPQEIRMALSRGLSLSGKVIEADGRVGGAAIVTARPVRADPAGSAWARTRPDGSFRLTGLRAEPHNVFAQSNVGNFALQSGVSPGAEVLSLSLRPSGRLFLKVVAWDGKPVESALVRVEEVNGAGIAAIASLTDSRGQVELAVPAGKLGVGISKENARTVARAEVPEGGVVSANVRLVPPIP